MSYTASYVDGYMDGLEFGTKPTAPFLVFTDAIGYRAPSFKHPNREAAEKEARRLAERNPDVNFYVLGSVSVSRLPKASASTTSLV